MTEAMENLPLDGIKVVEAGLVLAGPFCGSLLADLGAQVVKIERPGSGDPARALGPTLEGTPLWWGVASRDKLCVSLDLKQETDREQFLALIDEADIFVENYRPGVLERLGLNWKSLSQRNPGLIMMSISGFGQTGPYAGRPGFGKIAEALSGVVAVTGDPAQTPLHVGFSLADTSAGLMGTMAITMALFQRDCRGGVGAHIDVALYEPLFRMMELQFALMERTGDPPKRNGTNDPYGWGAPDATARRYVTVTCEGGEQLLVLLDEKSRGALVECIGTEADLTTDGLSDALKTWARGQCLKKTGRLLRSAGVEAARVHDGMSIAHEPYFQARGDVVWTNFIAQKNIAVPGHIPRGRGDKRVAFRPQSIGDANERVLGARIKTAEKDS